MLEKYRNSVYTCTRCGVCRSKYSDTVHYVCPVLENAGGFDHYCGRGRVATARGVLEGVLEYTEELCENIYSCLCCENCREQCGSIDMVTGKPAIDHAKIVRSMREDIVAQKKAPKAVTELAKIVSDKKNTFGMSLDMKSIFAKKYELPSSGDSIFFSGCYSIFRNSKEAEDTIKILKKTGENIAYLADQEWCCGVMQYWDGNTNVMRDMVFHNMEALEKSGAKRIITSCSGCLDTIRNLYPEIIEDELPFEVVHISEYLASLVKEGDLKFEKELNKKITYHDPCHLGRHAKIYEPPRDVIKAIPGVELVEMERNRGAAFCCGSGIGAVRAIYPDLAMKITNSRIGEALDTGAEVVSSACPMCVEQLELAGKKGKTGLEFINLPELVAKALGV